MMVHRTRSRLIGLAAFIFLIAFQEDIEMKWPALPSGGFLTGRAAEPHDVENGDAVFSMDGKSAGHIDIEIPQYALWTDENGQKHPVVVVQAERAPTGLEIVGLLMPDGSHAAATMPELKLLGTRKPDQ
jgi:hypothetical protein